VFQLDAHAKTSSVSLNARNDDRRALRSRRRTVGARSAPSLSMQQFRQFGRSNDLIDQVD
jgi:hypothetical protein